jgi:hypothetical protein
MSEIKHVFHTQRVDHLAAIGEELWEVITPEGERIAAAQSEDAMRDLEMALNMTITGACDKNSDITTSAD